MQATKRLQSILEGLGCRIAYDEETAQHLGIWDYDDAREADILFVLGGDGTILNAAKDYVPEGIPIVGINLGHLGFMSEIGLDDVPEFVELAEADDLVVDERLMVEARIMDRPPIVALNDFVVTRREHKMARINMWIGGALAEEYNGDGVIVATPTGSTAYSLSAGGPIVSPRVNCIVMTPLCSHSLYTRSIIASPEDRITLQCLHHDLLISPDGFRSLLLKKRELVEFKAAETTAKFLRITMSSFYPSLPARLARWTSGY